MDERTRSTSSRYRTPRSPDQRAADEAKIAQWLLEGLAQRKIAERLSITRQAVAKEIKRLRVRWRQEASADFAEFMGVQLATIGHVMRNAWRGWHKSRRNAERRSSRKRETAPTGGGMTFVVTESEATEATQAGDPRFLFAVLAALGQVADLLGLNAFTPRNAGPSTAASELPTEFVRILLPDNGRGDCDHPAIPYSALPAALREPARAM